MPTESTLKRQTTKIINDERMGDHNRDILNRYMGQLRISRASISRQRIVATVIRLLALHTEKPLDQVKRDDVEKWVTSLDHLGTESLTNYVAIIKAFYKWLYGEDEPECVSWLQIKNGRHKRKLPTDMITAEEVKAMINATDNARDKAIIACTYESGCRIGEISSLSIKDVMPDQYGAVVMVDGKTGMRRIRLIDSAPYITQWINQHPMKDNRDAPLFISFSNSCYGNRMDDGGMRRLFKILAKRAGIKKRIHPHLFRHARLTELAKDFTEQELKVLAGWTGGSRMAETYIHLSGADIEQKILQKAGLLDAEETREKNEVLKPRECPRCRKTNPATARFCYNCGMALDMKTAMEIDEKKNAETLELMDLIQREPRVFEILKAAVTVTK